MANHVYRAALFLMLAVSGKPAFAAPNYNPHQLEFIEIIRDSGDLNKVIDDIQTSVSILKSSSPSVGPLQLGRLAYNTYLSKGTALAGAQLKALNRKYTLAKACYLVNNERKALLSGSSQAVANIVALQLITGFTSTRCSRY